MKKVCVIGTVGLPACYGGFETLVENLVEAANGTIAYTVFCSKRHYVKQPPSFRGAALRYLPLKANGIQSVPYDGLSLLNTVFVKPDVTLILGVSGCLFLPVFKCFSRSKVVVNIDGIEWKREKWGRFAKAFLKLSERMAVKFSDVVVSDNQAVSDYVRTEYGRLSTVIPYGGDHAVLDKPLPPSEGYALALCRIEPENNVSMILAAFSDSKVPLKFVGNWDNSEFGQSLKQQYLGHPSIEILDPIYDKEALFEMRSKSLFYVHGHSAGGTNPSLVEMMFFAKPVIAFDCVFNRYTTENKALYFDSKDGLKKEVSMLMERLAKQRIGTTMQDIAKLHYTWDKVAAAYQALY